MTEEQDDSLTLSKLVGNMKEALLICLVDEYNSLEKMIQDGSAAGLKVSELSIECMFYRQVMQHGYAFVQTAKDLDEQLEDKELAMKETSIYLAWSCQAFTVLWPWFFSNARQMAKERGIYDADIGPADALAKGVRTGALTPEEIDQLCGPGSDVTPQT